MTRSTSHPSAPELPEVSARVQGLIATMTLEEKLAQLVGIWVGAGADGDVVAPMQDQQSDTGVPFETFAANGLGQLTRVFGTAPVSPAAGKRALLKTQRWLKQNTRLGIPALAHEECLTGLAAWQATTYPTPIAWGATFHPELIEKMGAAIGESMRGLGVHQGLAPVLDVVRDPRWGRVEECIGEDPYLVGLLGSAYVRGLQSEGIIATLKHFVGYSNSRAGRNLAPVHAGPREIADVLLIPFEMAILDAGARSVMHAYSEIDGLPVAADPAILTDLLRGRWGFTGTVVADYFGVAFLHQLHKVAADLGDAAAQALFAGVDVELPTGNAYLEPLAELVRSRQVDEFLVDRSLRRVLAQKEDLGLLDATFADPDADAAGAEIDLDPAEHRAIAASIAEESVILLGNDGILPVTGPARIAVVGPNADRVEALFGCYAFVNHVVGQRADIDLGIEAQTVLAGIRAEFAGPGSPAIGYARGCGVDDSDRSGIGEAVEAARLADLAVVVVGDQAGLFGRGTSGEGCDTDSLELPGVQRELVEAVLATGTPVVLVLVTGRPYAIGWAVEPCAAIVQAFFPGEEGAAAIAGVLSGRVNPSGRLPVSMPVSAGAQPYSYLHPTLGAGTQVSNLETTPVFPFGHGLSYTRFTLEDAEVGDRSVPTDGAIEVSVTVRNDGDRAGSYLVQLYGQDLVGSITRPVAQLLGFARVHLEPGESARVALGVPTTRLAFSDRRMQRVVEPGAVSLWLGDSVSSVSVPLGEIELVGAVHLVGISDARSVDVRVLASTPV